MQINVQITDEGVLVEEGTTKIQYRGSRIDFWYNNRWGGCCLDQEDHKDLTINQIIHDITASVNQQEKKTCQ